MDWFEEWFDSPLYEKLYADRNEEEAARLGKLIQRVIPAERYQSILDLGCGRGRHSLYLAQNGYKVTGIDLSMQAIKTAREKAERRGVQNVEFEVRDMRYPMDKEFDAAINLFTTFGYFETDEENTQVIDALSSMIKQGGKMIIDFMNALKVREHFVPESEGSFGDLNYRVSRSVNADIIKKEIEFFGNRLEEKKKYFEKVKLYEPSWFEDELSQRGFEVENMYGDYKGSEFDVETCERLIIVAEKA